MSFPVVIVTGPAPRLARALAGCGYAVVIVYQQGSEADGAVAEIERAGGAAVAIRAQLDDELDVERLFDETAATFGGVDVIVHIGTAGVAVVDRLARGRLRPGGAIFSVSPADRAPAARIARAHARHAARETTRGSPGANGRSHEPP